MSEPPVEEPVGTGKWFGPSGSCGCCGDSSPCSCPVDCGGIKAKAMASATVEITGIPATMVNFGPPIFQNSFREVRRIYGMDAFNDTYELAYRFNVPACFLVGDFVSKTVNFTTQLYNIDGSGAPTTPFTTETSPVTEGASLELELQYDSVNKGYITDINLRVPTNTGGGENVIPITIWDSPYTDTSLRIRCSSLDLKVPGYPVPSYGFSGTLSVNQVLGTVTPTTVENGNCPDLRETPIDESEIEIIEEEPI